jgi:phytoene synthase
MDEDLDDLVRRNDPDRWLSSRFIGDRQARADVIALYAYDHELARAPRVASNPILGEIRLTWWREVLDEVFQGRAVRHHPTAQALAEAIRRHDLPREPLEAMIDARYRELDAAPMSHEEAVEWARDTGGCVADAAAMILDRTIEAGAANLAGAAWALSKKLMVQTDLGPVTSAALVRARARRKAISVAAFPAVAHAALVARPANSDLGRRLRLTLAVATGRF